MTNAGDGSLELQGGASVDRAAVLSARVLELHEDRCNCAQSLACAFADIAQVDADTLFVLMEGFGAGMGGHAETCGAELQGGASVDRAAALSARVLELHEDRCNCAQSLACAFADIAQVDADTLFVLMEGFGTGMGGHAETCGAVTTLFVLMEGFGTGMGGHAETCGAVTAGVAVIGALASDGRASRTTKETTYEMASDFV